ncbi:SDR family NAD(P)-dependent oxidoreductase [Sphingomonas sp. 22176]|uniref:SDR family NAD(P)-dependent oxidoreductase n=1 Tax=Sphingomonas sp. 22176 TaxID=3453884 RepID=UPI003F879926
MSKTIVIFGAGSGLGISVARRFGREGYRVALIARRAERLESFAAQLRDAGISADAFPADLTKTSEIPALIDTIRTTTGSIDAIYFAPEGGGSFTPAMALTPEIARPRMELWYFSFLAVVNQVLPEMRERGAGAILVGFGGSAAHGFPFMSGPGPAMAATRNYLQSLHVEVAGEGIRVGIVTITAIIQNSESHQAIQSGAVKLDTPPGVTIPEADPNVLAQMLWDAAAEGALEVSYPIARAG